MTESLTLPPIGLEKTVGGEHRSLVQTEIEHARQILRRYGADHLTLVLHGSSLNGELRTRDADPDDPSDVDLLAIVSQATFDAMQALRVNGAEIGRVKSTAGAESLTMKVPSASGRLNPTEIDIYTQDGLARELSGDPESLRTAFITGALRNGATVVED
jgi:hypothetical protein